MLILKHNITGDVFGPYATRKLAIQYRPERDRDNWIPVSIGKRSVEEAMTIGAAITSAKVGRPPKADADKHARITITLPPATLAKLDAMDEGRSAAIDRLIRKHG